MALSASDIRSALSLPSHPRRAHPAAKKPDGISRELFSLIGPSAPSLAAHLAKPRLKQKPSFGAGGTVKWYAVPLPPPHPPQPVHTGNTDRSETAPAKTPSSSPTGSNSSTPTAVRHAPPLPRTPPILPQSIRSQSTTCSQSHTTTPRTSTPGFWRVRLPNSPPRASHDRPQITNGQRRRQTICSRSSKNTISAGMSYTTATITLTAPSA